MTATDAALNLLASFVLESGAKWGELAVSEQWCDAEAVLDQDGAPYSYLTRARGFSKTSDLAAMALAAMLTELPPGSRLYGLAADRDQGRLVVDALAGFVTRTPGIGAAVDVASYKCTAHNGTVLEILAADDASAWGLRPAWLIVDELAQWPSTPGPRRLWEAVTSAMTKVPGARLVVLTSAGDPAHWSHTILEHAYADPLWHVHEIPGPPPWADPARLEEQRRRLPESSYARLFLNRWTASEDRLTSLEDLRACCVLDGPQEPHPGKRYVLGLDLGVKNDRSVAAICHREADEVVLDRMATWAGSPSLPVDLRLVEEWVTEAARRYNGAEVISDPWQATGLVQRLRASGVKASEYVFSAQSVGHLAVTLHTCIRDHRLRLPYDEELIDELANVRLKETSPNVYRLDHDPDRHDDRAVALALCALHLLEHPTSGGWHRTYGFDACAQCSKVYPSTKKACPVCGKPTPERDETPNEWVAVYGSQDEGGPAPRKGGWFG